jgi:hypothetical protein
MEVPLRDPLFLGLVLAGSALLAAMLVLIFGRLRPTCYQVLIALGEALAVGVVFFLGCAVVRNEPASDIYLRWPKLPPTDAEDRLLVILLPAALLAELVTAIRFVPGWLAWGLRLLVAAGAAPVLLHNSQYLTDLAGPGTRLWSAAQTWCWLAGAAAALAGSWLLLILLVRRGATRLPLLGVSMVCAGAAPAIMDAGYMTEGPLLIPLAGALLGIAVGFSPGNTRWDTRTALGVGLVVLFGLLFIGCFYGDPGLPLRDAALLWFAPLLAWVPELLPRKKFPRWAPSLGALVLVAIPIGMAAGPALLAFYHALQPSAATNSPAGTSGKASDQDYQNFDR